MDGKSLSLSLENIYLFFSCLIYLLLSLFNFSFKAGNFIQQPLINPIMILHPFKQFVDICHVCMMPDITKCILLYFMVFHKLETFIIDDCREHLMHNIKLIISGKLFFLEFRSGQLFNVFHLFIPLHNYLINAPLFTHLLLVSIHQCIFLAEFSVRNLNKQIKLQGELFEAFSSNFSQFALN